MKTLYLLSISFLLLAAQCTPEKPEPPEPELPPITTTGEGTFGCKINGEVWLPKGSFPNVPRLTADWNNGNAKVTANNDDNDEQEGTIKFYVNNCRGAKKYTVGSDSSEAYYYNVFHLCEYDWSSIKLGEIEIIHLDTSKRLSPAPSGLTPQRLGVRI